MRRAAVPVASGDLGATSLPPWVLVRSVLAVVLVGFFVVGLSDLLTGQGSAVEVVLTVLALVALMAIQILYFARPVARLNVGTSRALLGVQAVLTFGMPLLYGDQWAALPGLLAGSALLVLSAGWRWVVFGLVMVLNLPHYSVGVSAATSADASVGPVIVVYTSIGAAITGLVVFGLCRLAGLVVDLRDSQHELVQAAAEQERLNLSVDLDQTIGRRLAEIVVRGEVTRKRPGRPPEQVLDDLGRILQAARHALTDARAVASRYRTLSLAQELCSAEQVLDLAGIRVRVTADPLPLAAEVETALAIAVREGVTELMRGRDVRECVVTLHERGDTVRLEIDTVDVDTGAGAPMGDGAPDPHPAPSSLQGSRARVTRLGGHMDVRFPPGASFRMAVEVPVVPVEGGDRPAVSGTARLVAAMRDGGAAEASFTEAIAVTVLLGFLTVAAIRAFPAVPDPLALVATLIGLALITLVQIAILRSIRPAHSPARRIAWAVQAALLMLPLGFGASTWVSLPGVVAGGAFLTWRPRSAWPLSLLVVVGTGLIQNRLGISAFELVFVTVSTVNSAVTTWAMVKLTWLVRSVHAGRHELAGYAVLIERLRVVRDVHDLLGLNLSAIALKGELAHRLVGRDDAAVEAELREIVQIARTAIDDLAVVTQGGPLASLRNDLEAIRSILRTAEVEVTERVEDLDLRAEQVEVCVAVLREGVTNMLRHSKVENCEIVLCRNPDASVLVELTSDGAGAPPSSGDVAPPPPAVGGAGLRNLRERVNSIGGTLDVTHRGDIYRLTVRLPGPDPG